MSSTSLYSLLLIKPQRTRQTRNDERSTRILKIRSGIDRQQPIVQRKNFLLLRFTQINSRNTMGKTHPESLIRIFELLNHIFALDHEHRCKTRHCACDTLDPWWTLGSSGDIRGVRWHCQFGEHKCLNGIVEQRCAVMISCRSYNRLEITYRSPLTTQLWKCILENISLGDSERAWSQTESSGSTS